MDARRSQRVSQRMLEELAEIVAYEMSDPRLGPVSVTEVHVSPDLRLARVLVALAGQEAERKAALAALDGARAFLRRLLAERLGLFRVPDLHFEADVEGRGDRLEALLRRIRKGRPREAGKGEKKPA